MRAFRYGLLLLSILAVGLWAFEVRRTPEVSVTAAQRRSLAADFTATGFVEAMEVTLTSKVTGRVVAVKAEEGQPVRRGEALVVLEVEELSATERAALAAQAAMESHAHSASLGATAAMKEAPAQVDQAQAALAEAVAQLSRLKHGSRPEEIDEARAAFREAEAGVKVAKAQLATAETVLDQQRKLSQAQVQEAEAVLTAARASEERVRAGSRPQEVAVAEAAVRDAKARRSLAEKESKRMESLYAGGAVSREQVDEAQTALAVSREAEAEAQERLSLAKEGARREERDAARAEVAAAEARLAAARASADQVGVRQREVDIARQQVGQAEQVLSVMTARMKLVEKGARAEDLAAARAKASQARAALQQARSSLTRAEAQAHESLAMRAQSRQAAAQTEQASLQRKEAVLRSPVDGVVARRLVDVGELVAPTTPLLPGSELMKLVDLRNRWVIAEVDAEDLGKVKLGQAVEVTAEAYPGCAFPGRVVRINPTAEPKPGGRTRARVVRVKVALGSEASELKPGLEVDVRGRTALVNGALVIPNDAIMNDGGSFVFVMQGGRVTRRPIRTGKRNELTTEATSGLQEGEQVVVRGKEGLHEGMRVKVVNQ